MQVVALYGARPVGAKPQAFSIHRAGGAGGASIWDCSERWITNGAEAENGNYATRSIWLCIFGTVKPSEKKSYTGGGAAL